MEFFYLLQKLGQSYAINEIHFSSIIKWIIICNLWYFFPFSKNMDYHMHFLKFLSPIQKRGLSYAIFGILFSSTKTWTNICIFLNFFLFYKNFVYHMQF